MSDRADIIATQNPRTRAARVRIEAPDWVIFDLLANPRMHARFDGSGTVERAVSGPTRLELGSTFGMAMRIRLPYRITNRVVEFEDNRRIAWQHFGGHRWRYELVPDGERATVVTETFDGSTSRMPWLLDRMDAYRRNEVACAKTLVRLRDLAQSMAPDS